MRSSGGFESLLAAAYEDLIVPKAQLRKSSATKGEPEVTALCPRLHITAVPQPVWTSEAWQTGIANTSGKVSLSRLLKKVQPQWQYC